MLFLLVYFDVVISVSWILLINSRFFFLPSIVLEMICHQRIYLLFSAVPPSTGARNGVELEIHKMRCGLGILGFIYFIRPSRYRVFDCSSLVSPMGATWIVAAVLFVAVSEMNSSE